MVIGENQKFASALIVPAFAFVKEWASRNGIKVEDNSQLIANKTIRSRIMEEVENVNNSLSKYETIKKIYS